MTIDEFMALSDVDRNILVTEKVMGWDWYTSSNPPGMFIDRKNRKDSHLNIPPQRWDPTTSIADAWEVVEKLRKGPPQRRWAIDCTQVDWDVYVESGGDSYSATDPSFPLAVCIAALGAVGAISD